MRGYRWMGVLRTAIHVHCVFTKKTKNFSSVSLTMSLSCTPLKIPRNKKEREEFSRCFYSTSTVAAKWYLWLTDVLKNGGFHHNTCSSPPPFYFCLLFFICVVNCTLYWRNNTFRHKKKTFQKACSYYSCTTSFYTSCSYCNITAALTIKPV